MKSAVLLFGLFLSAHILTAQTATVPAPGPSTESWKIDGNVQGVAVLLTCSIVETNKLITGSCSGDEGGPHAIKGTVQDKLLTWSFDSTYQGQPITVTLSGTLDATGAKMSGSIAVDPLQADGLFTAIKQPPPAPAAAAPPPAAL
jgi:hypothetical protein